MDLRRQNKQTLGYKCGLNINTATFFVRVNTT